MTLTQGRPGPWRRAARRPRPRPAAAGCGRGLLECSPGCRRRRRGGTGEFVEASVEDGDVVLTHACKCEPPCGADRAALNQRFEFGITDADVACSLTHRALSGACQRRARLIHLTAARPHFSACFHSQRNEQSRHTSGDLQSPTHRRCEAAHFSASRRERCRRAKKIWRFARSVWSAIENRRSLGAPRSCGYFDAIALVRGAHVPPPVSAPARRIWKMRRRNSRQGG